MSRVITVTTPGGGQYQILIGMGGLEKIAEGSEGVDLDGVPRTAVVTNTTLAPLYGETLANALPDSTLITIPDGEQYKTLDTVRDLYAEFVKARLDRSSIVFALGGGVVGDTVGFAAASYMRGISLVQIPTSLLAMVDSSVGGKVGVDLPEGKNLVGAFKQPQMVMIDLKVLDTLPEREWRCGMAEVLKHGLLADEALLDPALGRKENALEMIPRAIQVKVDVVQQDPYEKDIRAHLNLGHTFAHAIEKETNYAIPHGEAVSRGLMAAAVMSYEIGLCDVSVSERVESILTEIGLPMRIDGLDPEALYGHMSVDKKWRGGKSRFVLLEGIGQPTIVEGVPPETVIDILAGLR